MKLRTALCVVAGFLFTQTIIAQMPRGKEIRVIQHRDLVMNFADVNEVLTDKVLPGALEVKLENNEASAFLYARIVFNNATAAGIQMAIRAVAGSNTLRQSSGSEILLSAVPVKVCGIPANYSGTFLFDVIDHAADRFVETGTQKFSIIFSYSDR